MPDVSPYFLSSGASPEGAPIARLLMQRNALNSQAASTIGDFAGQITSGVTGAVEGAQNPGTFGAGTSTGMAALKGFAQNVAPAANGGMTVKQLQLAGKTADSFRAMVAAGQPKVDGQASPPVLGVDDDKWSTMSSLDKFNVVGATVKAESMNSALAGILYKMAAVGRQNSQTTLNQTKTDQITANAPLDAAVKESAVTKNNAQAAEAEATTAAMPAKNASQAQEVQARIGAWNAQAAKDKQGKPLYQIVSHISQDANGQPVVTPVVNATTAEGWAAGTKALKVSQAAPVPTKNGAVDPDQLTVGEYYQTNKGVLQWNGKKFASP